MKVTQKAHNLLRHSTPAMLEKSYIETVWPGAFSSPKSVTDFQTSSSENLLQDPERLPD